VQVAQAGTGLLDMSLHRRTSARQTARRPPLWML
jgi:hypothetical protein